MQPARAACVQFHHLYQIEMAGCVDIEQGIPLLVPCQFLRIAAREIPLLDVVACIMAPCYCNLQCLWVVLKQKYDDFGLLLMWMMADAARIQES